MPDEKRDTMKVDLGASGVKTVAMDFPSNAHSTKQQDPKKVEKVVTGQVLKRKKSLGKRLTEIFIADDITSVSSYLLNDVLIPAAKSALSDMVKTGIEMLLFGEKQGTRTRREQGRSVVSYNSYYNSNRREQSPVNRARHNFDDIILETRGEAEEVLSNLVDLIVDYGEATIADLYGFVGINETFTDRKYGWTDLSTATVSRVRDGYLINLPKATLLD